jgi:hypothetical protein
MPRLLDFESGIEGETEMIESATVTGRRGGNKLT